jgi:putative ATP-dependent endonuclease of OLD family
MELESFKVTGLRCLADIEWVPILSPSIITGPNDGGKTSLLLALRFLLEGQRLHVEDFTLVREGADPEAPTRDGRNAECVVEGQVRLTTQESEELQLPAETQIRRRANHDGQVFLEVLILVPEDERLRSLSEKPIQDLKQIAAELGVDPVGPKSERRSFLARLEQLAANSNTVEVWVPRDRTALAGRLPRVIDFSSTAEPDPGHEIQRALQEAYSLALDDPEIVGPVRAAESQVRAKLQTEAEQLKAHILNRCPELSDFTVTPSVSFKEGFTNVGITSSRGLDARIPLEVSGAGTRRRVTLAVWEWTRGLLEREGSGEPTSKIIAYDEPDTHLDYGHQRDLVDLIRAQSAVPSVRVLVATHSMNLIDKVPIENVIHLDLDDDRTRVRRLFSEEHGDINKYLIDIAASMGLRNSVLLHERLFVGVEGVTEQHALPILFRTATGMTLQSAGIALLPAGGNHGARAFCEYLVKQGREVRFVIDKDSTKQYVFRPEGLRAAGITESQMYLLGNPDEIEDLFSDSQWATAANTLWKRTDGRTWRPEDFKQIRASGKFSARLHALVEEHSEDAPPTKSALLLALATTLMSRDQVPSEILSVFDDLIQVVEAR